MIVSIIVAVSQNRVMGKDNKLPWYLPADLKYFKKRTLGRNIIMGRKTFESLGKTLPGRTNIIVTHQNDYHPEGAIMAGDLQSAFEYSRSNGETECMVIGGANIIRQSLPFANRIYYTKIFHDFEGDTFFPELNLTEWKLVSEEPHAPDESNKYHYSFQVYESVIHPAVD
jgi:dihydrofolate reductase